MTPEQYRAEVNMINNFSARKTADGKVFDDCFSIYITKHFEVRRYAVIDLIVDDRGNLTHTDGIESTSSVKELR